MPLLRKYHPAFQENVVDIAEIPALLKPFVSRANETVAAHRDAIETVASRLLDVDSLSAADLEALISRARVSPVRLPTWVSFITD